MRDEVPDPGAAAVREVELYVRVLVAFEALEHDFLRRAQHVVDLVDLVQLVLAREKGEEGEDLEEDAAHAPDVHLEVVVALREQALGGAVPPRGDVLRVALPLHPFARAEVDQFYLFVFEKDVLAGGYWSGGGVYGLMSRWKMPWRWMNSRPLISW